MHRKTLALTLIVLLAGLAPAAWAENHEEEAKPEAQAPSFFFVWNDVVSMAHAAEYEKEVAGMMAKLGETEAGKALDFFALSGEKGYTYVIPLADLADFMNVNKKRMAAIDEAGGVEAWDTASKLVSHGAGNLIVLRPDLSYTPAEPRAAEATGRLRVHDWWFVRPGHEPAIEAVARKLVALYVEKNVDTGWRVYQAVTGDDLPMYIVTSTATDPADHYANEARVAGLVGEAAQALLKEAMSHTRRLDTTMATMRPDLSMGM